MRSRPRPTSRPSRELRARRPLRRLLPRLRPRRRRRSRCSTTTSDDDGAFFPIADYDDLSVSQIMPLLSQLELDELEDVQAREVAGANRKTLVTEIDRYLGGELEAFTLGRRRRGCRRPTAPAAAGRPRRPLACPIAGYPDLNVPDVVGPARRSDSGPARAGPRYESARDNRIGVVDEIERRLEAARAGAATRRAGRPKKARPGSRRPRTATKKSATKRAATKKAAAKKAATKQALGHEGDADHQVGQEGRKSTKKATRFPIANYDELNVADIRPRLTDLSDNQLRQVREREAAGAGRKTILDDIDNRLLTTDAARPSPGVGSGRRRACRCRRGPAAARPVSRDGGRRRAAARPSASSTRWASRSGASGTSSSSASVADIRNSRCDSMAARTSSWCPRR